MELPGRAVEPFGNPGGRADGRTIGTQHLTQRRPVRYFKTSPEAIRLAVMLHVRLRQSLRNAEDLFHERGILISHEAVRSRLQRFGTMFA